MEIEESKNLIDYIVKHTDLNQADLARKLKVSRAQVSKWKAGDHLPLERKSELLKLAGLFDTMYVDWAIFAKSEENAEAWYSYVLEILEDVEWVYSLKESFQETPDLYVAKLITGLCDLGAKIEQQSPATPWIDKENDELTPLASALLSVLEVWGQLYVWIDETLEFEDLTDDVEEELLDLVDDLRWLTFQLALGHAEEETLTAIGVDRGKLKTVTDKSRQEIRWRLHDICRIRTKLGLPITEDYFQLLYLPSVDLAEQSWYRPADLNVDGQGVSEELIKSYLPYGQRLILTELEHCETALRFLDKKLDRIIDKLGM
jgi:transcriptional regulator with XRE-family HTH domain